ncbi:MAG: hypothetical protein HY367_03110 [Candidatus Aenigmarchaeota archaeon]|nr:hypothetical protein [Candidatus Aenigmarchaeota archaeon]
MAGLKEILPGIFTWEHYVVSKGILINGFYLKKEQVFLDPPKMDPYELLEIGRLGAPKDIIITNRDHARDAEHYRSYFKTRPRIWINEAEKEAAAIQIDKTFRHKEKLPGNIFAMQVENNKATGETALWLEKHKALVFGDALIGAPPGELNLLPRLQPSKEAREGVRPLLGLDFSHVLVAHGAHIIGDGRKVIEGFLSR